MSKRVGDVFHIEAEPPRECEMCGITAELRPYGPNEENVCFDCAMKDEAAAKRHFTKRTKSVAHFTAPADALAKARKQ